MVIISNLSQLPCAIFLKEFKLLVQQGLLLIVPRLENLNALVALGLTAENRKEILLLLAVDDYSSGPDPDHSLPGDVWKFGKQIAGKEIYIKLKIEIQGVRKIAKCLSFHIAEREVCYPFKTSK